MHIWVSRGLLLSDSCTLDGFTVFLHERDTWACYLFYKYFLRNKLGNCYVQNRFVFVKYEFDIQNRDITVINHTAEIHCPRTVVTEVKQSIPGLQRSL
jgi:hypothetical protein